MNRVLRTYESPEHEVSVVIRPKPTSAVPKVDPSAGVEHIGFTPTAREPLPAWAQSALKAPLSAPAESVATVTRRLDNGLRFSVAP